VEIKIYFQNRRFYLLALRSIGLLILYHIVLKSIDYLIVFLFKTLLTRYVNKHKITHLSSCSLLLFHHPLSDCHRVLILRSLYFFCLKRRRAADIHSHTSIDAVVDACLSCVCSVISLIIYDQRATSSSIPLVGFRLIVSRRSLDI
jgi:hypothetical protein